MELRQWVQIEQGVPQKPRAKEDRRTWCRRVEGEEGVSLQRIKAISRMSETIKVNPTCLDLLKTNSWSQEFLTSLEEEMELRQRVEIEQGAPQKLRAMSAGHSLELSKAWDQGPKIQHPEVGERLAE